MTKKLEYFLCLFLYSLKGKVISKNTLFRYVYIFDVASDYLGNYERINDDIVIDQEIGLGNAAQLTGALNEIHGRNYVTIKDSEIFIEDKLVNAVENWKKSEKVQKDLNRVMYFARIISSYDEDVILSVFFSEPNVEDSMVRGKKEVKLSDNRLKALLEEFETIANKNKAIELDKYDVFSSWLDYVFEEYLQEKKQ